MEYKISKQNSTVSAKVVFNKDEWVAAIEKAYLKLGKDVEVPGFRKGHAPLEQLKKHVNTAEVLDEACATISSKAFEEIATKEDVDLIARPEVKYDKITLEELEITFEMPVRPEITLGAYTGLEVTKSKVRVTKEEVDAKLKQYQEQNTQVQVKEGDTIEEGDVVNFDFEGFVDGKAFEGGKAEKYDLTIGSHQFIPGFEENMIGLTRGQEADVNVTFPEDYGAKELAGKKAVFKVKIHEISVKVVPEINDDLALDLAIEGVNTLEELIKHIKKEIKESKEQEENGKALSNLVNLIVDNATLELPEILVKNEVERQLEGMKAQMKQYGLTFEQYLQLANTTLEKLVDEQIKPDVVKNLKTSLVLAEVAKKENITVTKEDVEAELAKMAELYHMEIEQVREAMKDRISELENHIYSDRLLGFIKDNNKIL